MYGKNKELSMSESFFFLFFFKQKTAYEIRNCDWSSDVCSSDLSYIFSIKNSNECFFFFLFVCGGTKPAAD